MPPKKSVASKVVTPLEMKGDTAWFTESRFGMFIHWGLYSLAARHEWVKKHESIRTEAYQKYFDHFDPDLYDPRAWARAARKAGMRYFVVTTKHHEGFCLWDSRHTQYKAPNTPCGKDLLKPMVEAFRAEGLRVGFYYSLLDWHHPAFPVDRLHPQAADQAFRKETAGRDVRKYAAYMRKQVRELLTEFGKIDILWFDFSYPGEDGKGHADWQSEEMVKMIRKLQPDIIINNRLDVPGVGDVETPEQYVPSRGLTDKDGTPIVWEGCQTFSGSWGYHRDEASWKSDEMLVQMLVNHVSRNGNLLLNVGPTSRGEFDPRATAALEAIGNWMHHHERAIYGCGAAPEGFMAPDDSRYTYNPKTKRLYLHLFAWPFGTVRLPGLAGKVAYAQILHDGSEVAFRDEQPNQEHGNLRDKVSAADVTLILPVKSPGVTVPVIEIFLT